MLRGLALAPLALLWACGSDPAAPDTTADATTDASVAEDAADSADDTAVAADGEAAADATADAADADGPDATSDADDADTAPDTSPALPRPAPGPGFHTAGPWLQDALGRTLLLHGANVAQSTKYAPDRLPWHGAEDFAALAATGLDSVRMLIHWAAIMPAPGQLDEAWLDALGARLDWAAAAGLLVVLDMHQDLFGEGFGDNGAPAWACDQAHYDAYVPQSPWYVNYLSPEIAACFDHFYQDDATFGRFVDAWVAVATRFGDHPAVVGFDLLNEPHWGTADLVGFVPEVWQPRQEQLAAALHAVAPDRVIFFGSPPLLAIGLAQEFTPTATPRAAFAPHYYQSAVHDGTPYTPEMDTDTWYALDAMARSAANLAGAPTGVPVWVGEIGGPAEAPTMPAYTASLVTFFAERSWGFAWYSDDKGGDFALRNADGTFRPAVLTPLAHPYARRLPGPILASALDLAGGRFSTTFIWAYDAPLELWLGAGSQATATLAPADAPDLLVPCAPLASAPAGVVACAPPADVRWQSDYHLTLIWPVEGQ